MNVKNIIDGVSTVLDLCPPASESLSKRLEDSRQLLIKSDAENLRSDWENVGVDLKSAIERHVRER